MQLMTRNDFRNSVFVRDGHACVMCGKSDTTLDAHHIMERRLFPDGGYYLDNGATLCDDNGNGCHIKAEKTDITVEDILSVLGIKRITPPDLYPDHVYDKWGNGILANGTRTIGPLFNDESVQKVLSDHLSNFTSYVKYGRTYHLPWSDGITKDDKTCKDVSHFEGKRVIVTRKMDGENTSLYSDGYIHARSIDGRSHSSRDWVKAFWSHRFYDLPSGWRVVGENLFAKHSIKYKDLPTYIMGFGIYDDNNVCLSWDETVEYFELLDICPVPVLYDGIWGEKIIRDLYDPKSDYDTHEGYVVRLSESYHYSEFTKSLAKYVRHDHVTTSKHWMNTKTEINGCNTPTLNRK